MPKTVPPPHPRDLIIGAQRFYARWGRVLECPHCGEVYRINRETPTSIWNPRTARFACTGRYGCQRQYIIGTLAWPISSGRTPNAANAPPVDQVPGPRQLAQMREDGWGWWMPDEYKIVGRPDPTNLTGETDRPEPEDPIDLDLATSDLSEHRCEECMNQYNPLKSKARAPKRYCSRSCEDRQP